MQNSAHLGMPADRHLSQLFIRTTKRRKTFYEWRKPAGSRFLHRWNSLMQEREKSKTDRI